MKALSAKDGLSTLRLFGKINGTCKDYYIVEAPNGEGEAEGEPEEEGGAVVDKEAPGVGANKFAYYVACNSVDAWKKLPDVSAAEIEMSRKIKVLLTGDLERDIITNPFFSGKEKNYLRAQIARISASTTLLPAN